MSTITSEVKHHSTQYHVGATSCHLNSRDTTASHSKLLYRNDALVSAKPEKTRFSYRALHTITCVWLDGIHSLIDHPTELQMREMYHALFPTKTNLKIKTTPPYWALPSEITMQGCLKLHCLFKMLDNRITNWK